MYNYNIYIYIFFLQIFIILFFFYIPIFSFSFFQNNHENKLSPIILKLPKKIHPPKSVNM